MLQIIGTGESFLNRTPKEQILRQWWTRDLTKLKSSYIAKNSIIWVKKRLHTEWNEYMKERWCLEYTKRNNKQNLNTRKTNNSINNGSVINRVLKRRNANGQENKMVSKCPTSLGIRKLQTKAALDFILLQSEWLRIF